MIDVEGMVAFAAIAETGSFSRAADRLGVAQSVISKRLKRLEDQLGTSLIDRRVRTAIGLSATGVNYLPEVRAALDLLSATERVGRNLGRGASGPIRIGYIFSAAMNGTLNAVLSALNASLPEIRIDVKMMETPQQLAALADGRLDVGLVRPRWTVPTSCGAHLVHKEGLVVGHSGSHPLADIDAVVPPALAGQRFIIPQFQEKVGLVENLQRLAVMGGLTVDGLIRTADFVTATALAAANVGIVLAPASISKICLEGVRFRRIEGYADEIETHLVYRQDAPPLALNVICNCFDFQPDAISAKPSAVSLQV